MRIIESTGDKLVFRTGFPVLNVSNCDFDRTTGRAVIKRSMILWPRTPVDVPLADIVAVQSASVSNTMEDTQVDTLIPQIVLSSGKYVNLSVLTGDKSTAPKVIKMLREFLAL